MRSLKLALSFILIPRLFGSLLLWPLCVGLLVALGQVSVSAKYIQAKNTPATAYIKRAENPQRGAIIRQYLYNDKTPLPEITLCKLDIDANCTLDRRDIVLQIEDQNFVDPEPYLQFFNGTAKQLVICKDCSSALTIKIGEEDNQTVIESLTGLLLLFHAENYAEKALNSYYAGAKQHIARIKNLQGTVFFTTANDRTVVNLTSISSLIILIVNTSFIIIITLWLALRAHRKVLDYFAKNDCLLPMVAACGKNSFYLAIWILTILRVVFFLFATVPISILFFINTVPKEVQQEFLGNYSIFIIWLLTISASLGVAVVIASIAELKQRVSLMGFLYRYLPMVFCILGSITWVITLFDLFPEAELVNSIVASIPIFGLTPVILQPIIVVPTTSLIIHFSLSVLVIWIIFRKNARWFAAHLEEI